MRRLISAAMMLVRASPAVSAVWAIHAMNVAAAYGQQLIGEWSFQEGSGYVAHDSSGNSLDGTIVNAQYVPGRNGRYALAFNGSDTYVHIPNSPLLSPATLAISLWFKPSTTQSPVADILDKGHGYGSDPYYAGYVLQYDWTDTQLGVFYGFDNRFFGFVTPTECSDNQWHHLVANLGGSSGSTDQLYIDGWLIGSAPSAGPIVQNDSDLYIGRHRALWDRFFTGLVDDVRLYDGALTVTERPIPALWASSINGNWSDSSKWTGGIRNAIGAGAVFNVSTTAAVTVSLDAPVALGNLQFGNSGGASEAGYTLSGSGANTLTLNNSGYPPAGGGATIMVTDGTHVINASVVLSDNLMVTTGGTCSWTLSFAAASSIAESGTGNYSLTMSGTGGTLILSGSNSYQGGTIVTAGLLEVTSSNALPDGTSLTVGAGATLIFAGAAAPVAGAPTAIPEPGTLALFSVGVIGLAACARCRGRQGRQVDGGEQDGGGNAPPIPERSWQAVGDCRETVASETKPPRSKPRI
jgi:autotransporter-associated beta strand protein